MKCGMSFFNASVYKSNLKRFWPVWAGLTLILILLLPLPVLNAWSESQTREILRGIGSYGAVFLTFGAAAIAAMTVYGWMYSARSAGFTAALPLRREGMFLSCALAGYTMLALPGVIAAILTCLAALGEVGLQTAAALTLDWLGKYLLLSLCFFGFASLCAHLTGTLWILPVIYVLLNVAVAVFWFLISNVLTNLLPGYAGEVPQAAYVLSPAVRIVMFDWDSTPFPDWAGLLGYAAFGLLSAGLGLVLAKRRRMESATDTVAVPWLKPVFRWVFSLGFALSFASVLYLMLLDESYRYGAMAAFLLLGGFLGWVIAEMLVRKSYKVASSLKTFPLLAALLLLLTLGCAGGGFGYSRHIPAPEQVKTAGIETGAYSIVTDSPAEVAAIQDLHRGLASGKPRDDGRNVYVEYELNTGRTLRRRYSFESLSPEGKEELRALAERELASGLELLLQDERRSLMGYLNRYERDEYRGADLSERQLRELLQQGVLPDYRAGDLRLVMGWPFEPDAGLGEDYCYLSVESWEREPLPGDEGAYDYYGYYGRSSIQIALTPAAKNSWPLLEKYLEEAEEPWG